MIVTDFNIDKGLYVFQLDNFETTFHSHPAIEILIAEEGMFTIWVESTEYSNLKFAVIDANRKHKLFSSNCILKLIMIEHNSQCIKSNLAFNNLWLENGFYLQSTLKNEQEIVDSIIHKITNNEISTEYDARILAVLKYIDRYGLDYNVMIKTLQNVTNLSESRLSHLFKSNLGISLKKYLIWVKLKSTIKQHLHKQEDLFSALIKSGFYDQPHFSKNFKAMLGIKPSKAYNSRTLQVLSVLAS
jgi:AraC-like DNA-binding protein